MTRRHFSCSTKDEFYLHTSKRSYVLHLSTKKDSCPITRQWNHPVTDTLRRLHNTTNKHWPLPLPSIHHHPPDAWWGLDWSLYMNRNVQMAMLNKPITEDHPIGVSCGPCLTSLQFNELFFSLHPAYKVSHLFESRLFLWTREVLASHIHRVNQAFLLTSGPWRECKFETITFDFEIVITMLPLGILMTS